MRFYFLVGAGALMAGLLATTSTTGDAAQAGATGATSVRVDEPHMPLTALRIEPLDRSKWTDAHREVADSVRNMTQVRICLHNLELCRQYWTFTRQLTSHNTLPLRDKELLILRTAWLSRGTYIWGRHSSGTGRQAGLTDDDLVRIVQGPGAEGWSAFDAALLRAADELHTSRFITDATWKTLATRYNEAQLLEVIFQVGNYTLLTMFHNSVGLPLEPGIECSASGVVCTRTAEFAEPQ